MARRTLSKRERQLISIYVFLIAVAFSGMIGANFLLPSIQEVVLAYSGDAFKVAIGALIGTLSALIGAGDDK